MMRFDILGFPNHPAVSWFDAALFGQGLVLHSQTSPVVEVVRAYSVPTSSPS